MPARVNAGVIVLQYWDSVQGLIEQEIAFDSIDKLFAQCLEIRPREMVDRVILDGVDQNGAPRRLTLAFQSATVSELPT